MTPYSLNPFQFPCHISSHLCQHSTLHNNQKVFISLWTRVVMFFMKQLTCDFKRLITVCWMTKTVVRVFKLQSCGRFILNSISNQRKIIYRRRILNYPQSQSNWTRKKDSIYVYRSEQIDRDRKTLQGKIIFMELKFKTKLKDNSSSKSKQSENCRRRCRKFYTFLS